MTKCRKRRAPQVDNFSDARLLHRAFTERWPIPDHLRPAIMQKLIATVQHASSARVRIAAAKALIAADKLNLEGDKRSKDAKIELFLNRPAPPPPDPEYLDWKRHKLMEQQQQKLLEDASRSNGDQRTIGN